MWCVIETPGRQFTSVAPGADAANTISGVKTATDCISCGGFTTMRRSDVVPLCYGCYTSLPTEHARVAARNNDRPPLAPFEINTTEGQLLRQLLGSKPSGDGAALAEIIRELGPSASYPGILASPSIVVWCAGRQLDLSILGCLAQLNDAVPAHLIEVLDRALQGAPPEVVRYSAAPLAPSPRMLCAAAERWPAWFHGTVSMAMQCVALNNLSGLYAAAEAWPTPMRPATAAALVHANVDTSWILQHPESLRPLEREADALTLLVKFGGSAFAATQLLQLGAEATAPALVASIDRDTVDVGLVRVLLEGGAPPSAGLAVAAERGKSNVISMLLEHGADPNYIERGVRPLTRCITSRMCNDSTVATLLAAGARTPASMYCTVIAIQTIDDPDLLELLLASMPAVGKYQLQSISTADLVWLSYELAGIPSGRMALLIEHVIFPYQVSARKEWRLAMRRCVRTWSATDSRAADVGSLLCHFGTVGGRGPLEECAARGESMVALTLLSRHRVPVATAVDLAAVHKLFGGRTAAWRVAIRDALIERIGHILPVELIDSIVSHLLYPAESVWRAHISTPAVTDTPP